MRLFVATHVLGDKQGESMDVMNASRRSFVIRTLNFIGILAVSMRMLRLERRRLWCACGQIRLWSSDPLSSHCSHHLLDRKAAERHHAGLPAVLQPEAAA
jgi:hypothetical protein